MTGGRIRMLTWRYEKHTGKFLRMTGELVSEETQLVEIGKHFEYKIAVIFLSIRLNICFGFSK